MQTFTVQLGALHIDLAPPNVMGPLHSGVYVQIGLGLGFYVPQEAFDTCKRTANETGRIQFLTVDHDGAPVFGTREQCLAAGTGMVAWITPD